MSTSVLDEKKTTHRVDVVPLVLTKHPDADLLSVAEVDGWQCVTNTAQWAGHDRAAFVQPDTLVDVTKPEFAFLAPKARDGWYRVRAMKLRGVKSFGLLVPAPPGVGIGDDVSDLLGTRHYEPEHHKRHGSNGGALGGVSMDGQPADPPPILTTKYDLEPGRKFGKRVFTPGEQVVVHEKIHGANARYVCCDGVMYCGSRTEWKREFPDFTHLSVESLMNDGKTEEQAKRILDGILSKPRQKNIWWQALDATPELRAFCEANPDVMVFGEVYGAVQSLAYGCKKGEVRFTAFDLLANGRWANYDEYRDKAAKFNLPWAPLVGDGPTPFDFDAVCEMAEGKTLMTGADHIREGVVVRPVKERSQLPVGRVVLKWVGAGYLEKA